MSELQGFTLRELAGTTRYDILACYRPFFKEERACVSEVY